MARAAVALACMAAAVATHATARPLRVMSINECADQYVLALLPPSQITSVTWLSRDPSASIMAAAAMKVGVNHGAAEEVLRDKPDLVVAGAYTTPATRLLLKKLNYRVLELQPADSFAAVRAQTRSLAAALGAQARGEALIARMDAILRDLSTHPGPAVRVVAWDGAGFNAQAGTMYDALIAAAGARNAGVGLGAATPGVERLIATDPDLLVQGQPGAERPGLGSAVLNNPIVRRFWGDRVVVEPASYYVCGTPFSADGAARLRGEIQSTVARVGRTYALQARP
jgi:iron complex transport system substrate-binding protein